MFSRAPPIDAYVYKRGAILSSCTSVLRSVPRDCKVFLGFYLSARENPLIAPVFGSTILAFADKLLILEPRSNIKKINWPVKF